LVVLRSEEGVLVHRIIRVLRGFSRHLDSLGRHGSHEASGLLVFLNDMVPFLEDLFPPLVVELLLILQEFVQLLLGLGVFVARNELNFDISQIQLKSTVIFLVIKLYEYFLDPREALVDLGEYN
jgi:hypothetical protein